MKIPGNFPFTTKRDHDDALARKQDSRRNPPQSPSTIVDKVKQMLGVFLNTPNGNKIEHELRKKLASRDPKLSDIASLVMEKGVDPESVSKKHRNTALHVLAHSKDIGLEKTAQILAILESRGALDISRKNSDGNTPLHIAVEQQTELAKLLLKREFDLTTENGEGKTVFDIAQQKYLEAKHTAEFSYSKKTIDAFPSSKSVINDFHGAKSILQLANQANRDRQRIERSRFPAVSKVSAARVRFNLPDGHESNDASSINEGRQRLAEVEIDNAKLRAHIAQLEQQADLLATEYLKLRSK